MTVKRVLIIGGYGNFGRFIATALASKPQIQLIIGGRRLAKATALIKTLNAHHPALAIECDIFNHFDRTLAKYQPDIVIHTSGPFQGQDYIVSRACIAHGCHYIDLADSRDFVVNIASLDQAAKAKNLLICSGASSVPGLSSAIIEHYLPEFSCLEKVDYAIATAQLTNQGLATTKGVLSYAGKPFFTLKNGQQRKIFGWQGLRLKPFWHLKKYFLGHCDVPDLALFPARYPTLKTIRFQAGLELKFIHLGLYLLAGLSRMRLLPSLDHFAKALLNMSHWFNPLGNNNTGFYMELTGLDQHQACKKLLFEIYAEDGDGLFIPCIPAILLASRLASGNLEKAGATACVGLISLDDYLTALQTLNLKIKWRCRSLLD